MHTIKKTMKLYKPSSQTRDTEFDNLYLNFKELGKHVASMQSQFKASHTSWGAVFQNSKEACNTVDRAFGNDTSNKAKEFSARGLELLTEWDQQNKDLREGSSDTRFKDAEDQLNSYAAIIKTLTKQVDKRNSVCADLDYYRGKVEELSSKDMSKDKDQERFKRAENEEQKRRQEFEQINNEVKVQLAKVVEQKETVFMRCLAAFMNVNRRIMSRNPFDEVLRDYDYVLQGEWQPIEEYSPDFTPSYTAPLAHRGPSVAQINVPAGGNYVKALYDFTAENPEEISFKAGDMIMLNEVLDDNWMHGSVNGKEGIFPCNYVERV